MSRTAISVDVTVPHTLSQQAAWETLLATLQGQKDQTSLASVTVLEVVVNPDQFKLTATVRITVGLLWAKRTETQTLTFVVNVGNVRVTSDPADSWIEAGEMVAEAQTLKTLLTEALK